MRCAAFSAAVNRSVSIPQALPRCLRVLTYFRPLHIPADNMACKDTAVHHFHDKLLKIKDRLKTETGRRWAEQRHHFVSVNPLTSAS